MMDYTRVYTAELEMRRVDVETWSDTGDAIPINGLSIAYNALDTVPLIQTASVEVDQAIEDGWYRFYLIATQGEAEKTAIGTFLFTTSRMKHDYGLDQPTANGYSVLKPAELRYFLGGYAPEGSNGAEYAAKLLRECTKAPVIVAGGFTLAQDVVFQPGTPYLSCVWKLLDAAGFCIAIGGDGTISIDAKPTVAVYELNPSNIMPEVTEDLSTDMPNRYIAVQNGEVAIAENSAGDNPLSYKTRGYWQEVYDKAPIRVNGETLSAYANRKLHEASIRYRKVSYVREFEPGIGAFSAILGNVPDSGLEGVGRVASGTMDCNNGIIVSETAMFQEDLWTD